MPSRNFAASPLSPYAVVKFNSASLENGEDGEAAKFLDGIFTTSRGCAGEWRRWGIPLVVVVAPQISVSVVAAQICGDASTTTRSFAHVPIQCGRAAAAAAAN